MSSGSVSCAAREACHFQLKSSNSQSIMAAHSDCRVRLINQHEILSRSRSMWISLILMLIDESDSVLI